MSGPLLIERLGSRGDGIAAGADGPVYVPFALPGETVAPARPLPRIVSASPERVAPLCRHFGACGGCALQHRAPDATAAWKRGLVVAALAAAGLEADVGDVVTVLVASRRRAAFALARIGSRVVLGFRERAGHAIVDVAECPVVVPEIAAAMPTLRAALGPLAPVFGGRGRRSAAGGAASVAVLATATGLDVAVTRPKPGPLDARVLADLAAAAAAAGWARLTVDGDTVATFRQPVLALGAARAVPPPAAFVQASAEAERVLCDAVTGALAGATRVVDLFAGIGTFALRLAATASVHAVEGDEAALAALDAAVRRTPGLKPVGTERRDLDRAPLTAGELNRHDGLVFDPPRAGAAAQAREIAASKIPVVVGVSCNPGTFARDARTLVDGGYRLGAVTPVDQFRFSAHVELAAVFRR